MMKGNKFISFFLILHFVFIGGDKVKNLRKLQELSDIPFPDVYIFGISNYKYYENPYMIKYDFILRLANYSNHEVKNITMKLDILTSRLRFLEEEEVTCIKSTKMVEIYIFICSKEVNGPVSQISYINNSLILNGEIPINSSISITIINYHNEEYTPKGNSTENSYFYSDGYLEIIIFTNCFVYEENNELIFEGKTNRTKIESKDSILSFIQGEEIKNILCNINDKGNYRFKMICESTFNINANLSNNNVIYLNDLGTIGMMIFEEGKSLSQLIIENSPDIINLSSERNSKGLILSIIFLHISLIVIIIIIIILCKSKSNPKPTNQERDKNPRPSFNDTSLPSSVTSMVKT